MKNRKFVLYSVFVLGCFLLVFSCFSPWTGGDATVTIALGNSENSRVLLPLIGGEPTETLSYEVIISRPGGTQKHSFKPGAPLTVKVVPGKCEITVRAMGDNVYAPAAGFPSTILRALGEWSGNINAGNNTIPVTMYSATEVTNDTQLVEALGVGSDTRKEIIILKGGSPLSLSQSITRPIEIRAERNVTIASFGSSIFTISFGGKLTLKGPLTLDGLGGASLINIPGTNGELYMYDGVILTNANTTSGGGVMVNGGKFYMYGGTITGNNSSSGGNGGGVYVMGGGEFTMSGGIISDNTVTVNGGGVYVANGTFTMQGNAEISDNTAVTNGGGVYVTGASSSFIIAGGTIYGQGHALANTASSGHALFVNGATGPVVFGDGITGIPGETTLGSGVWNDTIYGRP